MITNNFIHPKSAIHVHDEVLSAQYPGGLSKRSSQSGAGVLLRGKFSVSQMTTTQRMYDHMRGFM